MRRFIFFVIPALILILLPVQNAMAQEAFRPSYATGPQTMFATVLTVVVAALFVVVCVLLIIRKGRFEESGRIWHVFLLVILLALALRIMAALVYKGFETDIACFKGWAVGVHEHGMADFYTSGLFADYPPGYMYVLGLLGWLREVFSIETAGTLFTLIIKLPSITAEVLTALVVYRAASREIGKMFCLLCASFLLFNPALFFNSSVWGQIDNFFILFAVLTLYYLRKDNPYLGALFFAAALLIKPQAIMLAPVIGLCYLYPIFKKANFWRGAAGILGGAAIAAAVFTAGVLPFMKEKTFAYTAGWIYEHYRGVIESYQFASVNAFNLFALTGGNWVQSDQPLWLLTYQTWGYIFIGLSCAAVVILQWRARARMRTFDLAAFLVVSVFMLAHSMHERYILPACVFLLFAYVYTRDSTTLLYGAAFSVTALFNQMVVLYADSIFAPLMPTLAISAANVALYLGFAVHMAKRLFSGAVVIKAPAMDG